MLLMLAFLAALVRGYSGFGFAMILTLGMLTVSPPAMVIPVVLMLDLLCSVSLWPSAWKNFDGKVGGRLVLGMLLAVPIGALALARLPPQWMAPVAALLCLGGGLLVLGKPAVKALGICWALPVGLASGLATAMASAGGPPLMVYLLRSGLPTATVRGTAIGFFALSSGVALLSLWGLQALTLEHGQLAVHLLLPALAGNVAGQLLFRHKPMSLQLGIGVLLVLLSAATLAKTVL